MQALSAHTDFDEPEPTSNKLKLEKKIDIYLISKLRIGDEHLKLYKDASSNLEVERDFISTPHRDEMERS
jgi:hypothetical protein